MENLYSILWESNLTLLQRAFGPKLSQPPLEEPPLVLEPGDSVEEINKWILARKRNYPSSKKPDSEPGQNSENLSRLEIKLRKKIRFIKSDCGETRAARLRQRNLKALQQELS